MIHLKAPYAPECIVNEVVKSSRRRAYYIMMKKQDLIYEKESNLQVLK